MGKLNIWERRAIARKQQERHIRRKLSGIVEEALCFLGLLGWLSFLGYAFLKEVFK